MGTLSLPPEPDFEVTPAMIQAGVTRLLEYSPETDIEEEAAREIFLAMWLARPAAQLT